MVGGARGAGVSLVADATEQTVGVASAVAAGVADALALELEPATRLSTITVEASRNVVAHAYTGEGAGPLELRIATAAEEAEPAAALTVSVRDTGKGMALTPTPADPPGLGLPIICALSDALAIHSVPASGTALDATVALSEGDGARAYSASPPASRGESALRFDDPELLAAVLPRALAAHVRDPRRTLNRLAEVMLVGDAIATAIASTVTSRLDDVRITCVAEESCLRLRVGPLPAAEADRLLAEIGGSWRGSGPSLGLGTEPGGEPSLLHALVDASLSGC